MTHVTCKLSADCQAPGSAPEPYSRQSSMASFIFLPLVLAFHSWHAYRRRARVVFLADEGRPANRPHTDNTAACWFVINRTADSQPCQRPTWTISFLSAACVGRLAPTALIPTRNNDVEQLREQICKRKSPRESAVALLPSRGDWLHRFPGRFTDTSEHIRFLLFSFSAFHFFSCWFRALD